MGESDDRSLRAWKLVPARISAWMPQSVDSRPALIREVFTAALGDRQAPDTVRLVLGFCVDTASRAGDVLTERRPQSAAAVPHSPLPHAGGHRPGRSPVGGTHDHCEGRPNGRSDAHPRNRFPFVAGQPPLRLRLRPRHPSAAHAPPRAWCLGRRAAVAPSRWRHGDRAARGRPPGPPLGQAGVVPRGAGQQRLDRGGVGRHVARGSCGPGRMEDPGACKRCVRAQGAVDG